MPGSKEMLQNLSLFAKRWATWIRAIARYGYPRILIVMAGGLGDDLMCTAAMRELRLRGQTGIWMATDTPELFQGNDDVDVVVPLLTSRRLIDSIYRHKGTIVWPLFYMTPEYLGPNSKGEMQIIGHAPQRHAITCICEMAGITGEISIRPYLHLTTEERQAGHLVPNQVAIMSCGYAPEKTWMREGYQAVVNMLRDRYNFIQLGVGGDPLLDGVQDMRGRISYRQAAAILSQSLVFIGQEGFLAHLARAVDCRAVIVLGGRVLPVHAGYICNENLTTTLPCSPCGRVNCCEYDVACMKMISPEQVVTAAEKQIQRHGQPLAVEQSQIVDGKAFTRHDLDKMMGIMLEAERMMQA